MNLLKLLFLEFLSNFHEAKNVLNAYIFMQLIKKCLVAVLQSFYVQIRTSFF